MEIRDIYFPNLSPFSNSYLTGIIDYPILGENNSKSFF